MTPPSTAKATATIVVYENTDGTLEAVAQAPGLTTHTVSFSTYGALLTCVAEVLSDHRRRQMPAGLPLPALPDVSFDVTEQPERP